MAEPLLEQSAAPPEQPAVVAQVIVVKTADGHLHINGVDGPEQTVALLADAIKALVLSQQQAANRPSLVVPTGVVPRLRG